MTLQHEAPLPAGLDLATVPTRTSLLTDHPIRINASRWRRLLRSLDLPPAQGPLADGDWIRASRADVFAAADADIDSGAATQLFYLSLAWGLGAKARNLPARLDGYARSADFAPHTLARAWQAVRDGREPEECYEILMHPKGRGRIPYYGPAFATKYLYFASGTRQTPRLLILDAVVARRLRDLGVWESAPTANWWASTYQAYCSLLGRWAHEAAQRLDRAVAPDEIEFALFQLTPPTAA